VVRALLSCSPLLCVQSPRSWTAYPVASGSSFPPQRSFASGAKTQAGSQVAFHVMCGGILAATQQPTNECWYATVDLQNQNVQWTQLTGKGTFSSHTADAQQRGKHANGLARRAS